jgi:hypothetical protein
MAAGIPPAMEIVGWAHRVPRNSRAGLTSYHDDTTA